MKFGTFWNHQLLGYVDSTKEFVESHRYDTHRYAQCRIFLSCTGAGQQWTFQAVIWGTLFGTIETIRNSMEQLHRWILLDQLIKP